MRQICKCRVFEILLKLLHSFLERILFARTRMDFAFKKLAVAVQLTKLTIFDDNFLSYLPDRSVTWTNVSLKEA